MIKMMRPVIAIRERDAFLDASNFASSFPSGNFEKAKNKATAAKTLATIRYKLLTFVTVTFADLLLGVPKRKKLTMIGPNVVPKELIPPARFNRCEPVAGSPRDIAKGCAAVCCRENPSATIKNDTRISGNELALAEGIMANAPIIEMPSP